MPEWLVRSAILDVLLSTLFITSLVVEVRAEASFAARALSSEYCCVKLLSNGMQLDSHAELHHWVAKHQHLITG